MLGPTVLSVVPRTTPPSASLKRALDHALTFANAYPDPPVRVNLVFRNDFEVIQAGKVEEEEKKIASTVSNLPSSESKTKDLIAMMSAATLNDDPTILTKSLLASSPITPRQPRTVFNTAKYFSRLDRNYVTDPTSIIAPWPTNTATWTDTGIPQRLAKAGNVGDEEAEDDPFLEEAVTRAIAQRRVAEAKLAQLSDKVAAGGEEGVLAAAEAKEIRKRMDDLPQARVLLGSVLVHGDETISTQTLSTETLRELPIGSVVVSDRMHGGRGRRDNTWTAPPGSLCFTFSCSVSRGTSLPFVQYIASLALVHAVRNNNKSINLRIKWPNDIYLGDKKIAGILCSSTSFLVGNSRRFVMYVGIGVNVDNAAPTTSLNEHIATTWKGNNSTTPSSTSTLSSSPSTSSYISAANASPATPTTPAALGTGARSLTQLSKLIQKNAPQSSSSSSSSSSPPPSATASVNPVPPNFITREDLLADTLAIFSRYLAVLNDTGFGPLNSLYTAEWLHNDQIVQVEGRTCKYRIEGIAHGGGLKARKVRAVDDNAGSGDNRMALLPPSSSSSGDEDELELEPDGNSFDMSQSFVARKR